MGSKTKLNYRHRICNIFNNKHYKTSRLIQFNIKFPKTLPSRNWSNIFQEIKLVSFTISSQSLEAEMGLPSILTKIINFFCRKLSFSTNWICWDNRKRRCHKIWTSWMKITDLHMRTLLIFIIISFKTREFRLKERQISIIISLINSASTITSNNIILNNNNKSKTSKISFWSKTRISQWQNCKMNLRNSYNRLTKFLLG